jgi:hypothetical protein
VAPNSPADALGSHTEAVRGLLVDVVRARTDYAIDAHQAARTRYASGFGTQWRDLLDDAHEALTNRGFRSHSLAPGGYKLPVVNDCLIYVWRVSVAPGAVKNFASSPTRLSGFIAPPPPAMLWEGDFTDEAETGSDSPDTEIVLEAVREKMPLVLVMVWSTPRQLQTIEWAVARLDGDLKVQLHGQEALWKPEPTINDATADVESFDSGAPVVPVVALQTLDRPSDA